MCSSPDIPPAPPPPQEVKQPTNNLNDKAKRNRTGIAMPSLLTGPSGAAGAPTGRATLLGQ